MTNVTNVKKLFEKNLIAFIYLLYAYLVIENLKNFQNLLFLKNDAFVKHAHTYMYIRSYIAIILLLLCRLFQLSICSFLSL